MEGCHSETHGALIDEVHSGKGPHLESLTKVVVNNYLPNLEHEEIQIRNELLVGLGRNCNRLIIPEEQRSPSSCTYIGQDGFTGFLQETSDGGIQMGLLHQKANGAMGKRLTYGAAVGKHALRQQARRRRRNTCIATGNSPPITRVTMKSSAPSAACSPSGLSPTNQQYSVNPNHCSPQPVKLEPSQISDSIADAGLPASFQVIEGVSSRTKNAIHLLGSDSMARIIVSKLNPATCGKISIDSSYNSYSDISDYYDRSSPTTSRISPVSSFLTSPVVRTSSRLTGNSGNYSGAPISGTSSLQSQHINSSLNLNSQSQGSRSLRICLPQQSPSNKDSLSPSMTTMQTFLASIPGFKPRKRSQRKLSTAAQLALTKEGSVDLETPDSILVNVNLKSLVNAETYLSLPPVYQQRLAQLLPRVDQVIAHDNIVRIAPTGFHNEFLARACLSWRERLREGEFTHDNQVKLKGEAEKERSKLDPWKVAHFEPVWGMKYGNFGEELERESNSFYDYFGEENDTSFSSSSSLNQSPLSPTYSEEYFTQLKKVIEFIASRDKRRKDRKDARKVELMLKLNEQENRDVEVALSEVRDVFATAPDNILTVSSQDDSSYSKQFHPSYDENCDGSSISLSHENVPCQAGISEIELKSNLFMKRKESPVNIEFVAKKLCSEESVNLPIINSCLSNNVEVCESLKGVNHVNYNETVTEVINQKIEEDANDASEQTIGSMNKTITDGDDCISKNYSDSEHSIFDTNDGINSDNLDEQNCLNKNISINLPINETKSDQNEENEQSSSDLYNVEINENIENENKFCENTISDNKNDVQICDNVIKVSKISKKGIFGQYGHVENKSHVRVIPYNILTVNEALLHSSEGTFGCNATVVPSSQPSPSKSPINKKVFIDSSVVVTSSGVSNLPIQIQSHSISPKVETSSPSRQNTVLSNKIRVSPVNIVLSQSPSHCANVMSIASASSTAAPSVPSSSKRKAPQSSLYGCPVTLKISKSRGGVNLQRSYEIVQGVIANSPNRDQLKAQLKHHTVLMAESKNSVDNILISPAKSNSLSLHTSSDKEPMQISMQPRTSQFLVPQDNTSPSYSLVKSLSNERVNVSISPTATSVGQILPTGQRLFRSVALPFTTINTVGNTLRIRPVTPQANVQTESSPLGSNLQFVHQNPEGCKSVINNSVPIRILRPASGGKPVYLRTLSVSNIHLVRVSDILNNSLTEGDQQPPRASSAPPSRNSIIASVIPRPNSVGPRILIPTSSSASAFITSSTSSPTHHFLSEGDPSSGVISINSDKILSKGTSQEGIDAVDEQTRAGASHTHTKVSNSHAQHSFVTNDNVQFYDLKRADDNLLNFNINDLQSNTSMQQCNMDNSNQNQESLDNNSQNLFGQDEKLFDHANHSDSGESIKSEHLLNCEPKMSEQSGQGDNYESYDYGTQQNHDNTENDSKNDFDNHNFNCNENEDYDSNLKAERVDEEQLDDGSNIETKAVVMGNFTPLDRPEMQHHASQQELYQEFQSRGIISDLQRNCSNKSELALQDRLQLSHPATYQIVSPGSSQNYQQNLLQKQAFFIQQRQQCIRAPIHHQEPFHLQTQNAYQSVNLNPNLHVQQTNNQPMALNIQTFTNVNNNQISGNALSIVSIDNDGGPSSNGSEDGCPCNMRAMVACMKCGAFCHHDCVSPSRLCVTCLIR